MFSACLPFQSLLNHMFSLVRLLQGPSPPGGLWQLTPDTYNPICFSFVMNKMGFRLPHSGSSSHYRQLQATGRYMAEQRLLSSPLPPAAADAMNGPVGRTRESCFLWPCPGLSTSCLLHFLAVKLQTSHLSSLSL